MLKNHPYDIGHYNFCNIYGPVAKADRDYPIDTRSGERKNSLYKIQTRWKKNAILFN